MSCRLSAGTWIGTGAGDAATGAVLKKWTGGGPGFPLFPL